MFSLSTSGTRGDGVEPMSKGVGFVRGFWTFFFLATSSAAAAVAADFRLSAFLCSFSAFCRKEHKKAGGGIQPKFSNGTYLIAGSGIA